MRIVLISPDWVDCSAGGIATITAALAIGLHELGVDVEVWTRGGGRRGRAIRESARSDSSHPFVVRPLPGRNWRKRGQGHWRRGLSSLLPTVQPDLVILTTWEPLDALSAALACVQVAPPEVAVMAHGRDVTGTIDSVRRRRRERAWRTDVRWLVLSHWLAGELARRGVAVDRISQIPAAVLDLPEQPVRRTRPPTTLMTVGRLIPRKGQDVVIEALSLLKPKHPDLRYLVVGDGPDRERLQEVIERCDLNDRVELRGWLPPEQLEQAWHQADLFVMPAREELGGDTEGYGLVYLEAGARGLAVVGGRSGGVEAAVRPGDNGELIDDPRAADELATVVASLLSDPKRMTELGAGGRRAFEEGGRPRHLAKRVCELFTVTGESP